MQSDRLRHQNSTSPHWMENVHAIQASSDLAEPLFCFSSDPGFRGQWRVAHMRARADSLRQRKKKKAQMPMVVFALGRKASSCWLGWSHDMMPAHAFGVSGHFSHFVALSSHYPDLFTILLRFPIFLRCHWLEFHSAPLPLHATGQVQRYAPSNIRQTP